MSTDLFSFIDLYRRQLDATAHLLAKGSAHAAANGIEERTMLGWRLAEDMHPLGFQVMVVVNFSQSWPARAIGIALPPPVEPTLDMAGFQAAIADAKAWLAALTADQFAGRDDVPLTVPIMPELNPTLPSGQWLTVFATTNIYFHVAMVYAILRNNGVALGKTDMFPSGF